MEEQTVELIEVPSGKRTSMDNMMCVVDYVELSESEIDEVEYALAF